MNLAIGVVVTLTDPVDVALGFSAFVEPSGKLSMELSSKLVAPNSLIVDGKFNTIFRPVSVATTVQKATVDGDLEIAQHGTLSITDGAEADQFGRLDATGDVTLAGTVQMEVNGATRSPECDIIKSSKKFKFLAGSKLTITATGATAALQANRLWNVIDTLDDVIFNVPAPGDAQFNATKQGTNKVVQIKYVP